MNNQEFCCQRRRCCFGYGRAICFLGFVFALALGVILGAFYYETILPAIASVIAFAAVIAVVIVVLIIAQFRQNE